MRLPSRHLTITAILLTTVFITWLATPKRYARLAADKVVQRNIPDQVGQWRSLDNLQSDTNPELANQLSQLYSEIISKTYQDGQGNTLMLLIAYGTVQDNINHVHRPEICYPAQGFTVPELFKTTIPSTWGNLPVMRMEADKPGRDEWVTYWIRVGNDMTRGMLEQNLAQLKYGLLGQISDGLLFRVSIIRQGKSAFGMEDQFIRQLLTTLTDQDRRWLIGNRHAS